MAHNDTVPAGLEPAKVAESPPPAEKLPNAVPKDVTPPATAAPIQYKIIKVKKPDGTIVKVKRPITLEGMRSPVLHASSTDKVLRTVRTSIQCLESEYEY
jgi:hypothetical protein